MDISYFVVFLLVYFLLLLPYFTVIYFRNKSRNQQIDYRLKTLNRIKIENGIGKSAPAPVQQVPPSRVNLQNFLLYVVLPIPALFIIFLNDSVFVMILEIGIYFLFILGVYFTVLQIRRMRYIKKFNAEFPNAIELVIRNLRAGRTIIDAIKAAGEETKQPVSTQFKSIVDQVSLGRNFISVINDLSVELKIPEFTFFGIVLSVQQETGGNIIKTLTSLVSMLRGRSLMRLKVKALAAEGIVSAIIMASLPFIIVAILYLIKADYLSVMFNSSLGQKLLIAGGVFQMLGCLLIINLVRVDV